MTQTLEQLSAAATEGEVYADCDQVWIKNGPQICDAYGDNLCENAAFIVALWNAYRAGQLVAVSDDAIERVARALYEEDDPWHKAWPWPDLQPDQGDPDTYRRLATAAIAAMNDTQPALAAKGTGDE